LVKLVPQQQRAAGLTLREEMYQASALLCL